MSSNTYTPQPGSTADRVINFFKRLPDEELSTKDIALKFSVDTKNVLSILQGAVLAEHLLRDGTIYSAGPNIRGLAKVAQQPQQAAVTTPKLKPIKKPRVVIEVDIAAVVIHSAPCPDVKRRTGLPNIWVPLLVRLEHVGQWVKLPLDANAALGGAISKRHKTHPERYRRAKISPTEMIVERVL